MMTASYRKPGALSPFVDHASFRVIDTIDGREWCRSCLHEVSDHDAMSDCHHPDKRTRTGLCKCSGYLPKHERENAGVPDE